MWQGQEPQLPGRVLASTRGVGRAASSAKGKAELYWLVIRHSIPGGTADDSPRPRPDFRVDRQRVSRGTLSAVVTS